MLFAFGRLEFALGLWVANIAQISYRAAASFHGRLRELERAVDLCCADGSPAKAAYKEWIARAQAVRNTRNQLIHGRWGVDPESEHVINVLASQDCSEQREIRYTLEALAAVVESTVALHSDLGKLQMRWPL